jgi:putative ABC transport system ATP-binding protein
LETAYPFLILAARDLTKTYGRGPDRFDALKGVINRGDSVAIVGKGGSGKSTLMHLLALLDSPGGGSISVEGTDAKTLNGRKLNAMRNTMFGFVFQQFILNPTSSVLENVVLPLKIAGTGSRERRARGMAVLEQLELADKARNKAANLSGGQKQRVVSARALVNNPQVLFADEPTGNLDTARGKIVEDILFDFNINHGITLITVTHDHDLAARFQRRLYIRDGQLIPTDEEHAG